MIKVLLVEDDQDLGRALHEVLLAHQFQSTWVKSGEDGMRFLKSEQFDLLLFDIALPKISGLDLLAWTREAGLLAPVMMVTARDNVHDRVFGLDAGADDYLGKPFAVEELLSRIRALLRRHSERKTALWVVGDLTIDTARNQVKRGNEIIHLSKREFSLLCQLAGQTNRVLTRSQLTRGSGAEDFSESNAVDVHIYSLRKKIGAQYINTVRGIGYVLEAPV
jgi:DNA-binding response OmpR family regulator